MQDYVRRLRILVNQNAPRLLALSEVAASARPAPGKWSPREVVGHLVDSASNNHHRFVRAQFQQTLEFGEYDQDAWVKAQAYQSAPWDELVTLWRGFNLHLARVMEAIPEPLRLQLHTDHNLDKIAWQTVPAHEPTTLDYLMRDYVAHLEHHLRQILGHTATEGVANGDPPGGIRPGFSSKG